MKKKRLIFLIAMVLLLALTFSACKLLNLNQTEQEIKIIFNTNGGTPINSIVLPRSQVSEAFIQNQRTTKEGYDIDYWYVLNNDNKDKNIAAFLGQENLPNKITFGVVWKVKKLTLTVSQNLDTQDAKFTVEIDGEKQTNIKNPFTAKVEYNKSVKIIVDSEYSLDGIGNFNFVNLKVTAHFPSTNESTSTNESSREFLIENIRNDVKIESIWKSPREIPIDFYNNIKATEAPVTKNLGVGLTHKITPTSTKIGSVFSGWYEDKDNISEDTKIGDANGYISGFPTKNTPPNTKLFAYWESNISVDCTENGENEFIVNGISQTYQKNGIKRIYIPSKIGNKPVTEISDSAFQNLSSDYEVIIPYTVDTISNSAFNNYQGNIYFDMASKYTLISAPRFNEAHNIYVHATNVKKVVGDSDFKNIYTYGSGSLIDGAFINYFGEIVTDYTDTLEKIDQWHKYSVEFTLENYVALNCEGYPNYNFSKVMDDLNAQNNTVIANDSVEGEKNWAASGKTIKLPKQEIQTTKRIGEEQTEGGYMQEQVIDLLYKENDFSSEEKYLPIEFLPEIPVFNSEQAIRVVQQGYQPIFISKKDGAPRDYWPWAKDAYEKGIDTAKKIISKDMNDFEKVEAIHDWIVMNNIYDSKLLEYFNEYDSKAISHFRGFSLEGVLLDGKGVCDSISKTFLLMTKAVGIECIKVEGISYGGGGGTGVAHAWNKVKIDDEWYVIDVTGNAPLIKININEKNTEILKHTYYLVPNSDPELKKKNSEKEDKNYPEATGRYDYFENKTYDGHRSIKVKNKTELDNYLNWVKDNTVREDGKLYSLEVFVENSGGIFNSYDASSRAAAAFGSEYYVCVGDPKGHCVLIFKK